MICPDYIARAIKSGGVPVLRDWRKVAAKYPDEVWRLTPGEQVCHFIEESMVTPEGEHAGTPFKLQLFQEYFIQAIFKDDHTRARKAVLSVGRKAGKTTVSAAIMLALMFMRVFKSKDESYTLLAPMSRINSAALSREQAALLHTYMAKILVQSSAFEGKYRIVPSGKRIVALKSGCEYTALAAESGKAMGLSPGALVGDEWGQVAGSTHPYIEALTTSMGAHKNPLLIIISTQAPSDASYLSLEIDDATLNPRTDVVCHLYTADPELDYLDKKAWMQACPAVHAFRSAEDIKQQAEVAKRMPSQAAAFENLILNRRVSLDRMWCSPDLWRSNKHEVDLEVFRTAPIVAAGLDLSARNDLTACVLAARDDEGFVHVLPFVFTPSTGIEDRARRDRAPYVEWVKAGKLIPIGGAHIDYKQVATYMRDQLQELGIEIDVVCFDRWRISLMKAAAEEVGFAQDAEWLEVGQGFQSFSPRLETLMKILLDRKLAHGSHPLLNMAVANAISVMDPAGSTKLDKSKSTQRIDPLVALVMAAHPVDEGAQAKTSSYLEATGSGIMFV